MNDDPKICEDCGEEFDGLGEICEDCEEYLTEDEDDEDEIGAPQMENEK